MRKLGIQIRNVREIKNLSQSHIASKLGISQSAYSSIENGKTKIDEEKLNDIALALDVKPEVIKNFNEQTVFNSCIQSEKAESNSIEKIEGLYQQLLQEKETRIHYLENLLKNSKE
jgi:transcriptional regulator with XRE-family HTH domain